MDLKSLRHSSIFQEANKKLWRTRQKKEDCADIYRLNLFIPEFGVPLCTAIIREWEGTDFWDSYRAFNFLRRLIWNRRHCAPISGLKLRQLHRIGEKRDISCCGWLSMPDSRMSITITVELSWFSIKRTPEQSRMKICLIKSREKLESRQEYNQNFWFQTKQPQFCRKRQQILFLIKTCCLPKTREMNFLQTLLFSKKTPTW